MGDLRQLSASVLGATDAAYLLLYSNRTGSSLLMGDLTASGLGCPGDFLAEFTVSPPPATGYAGLALSPMESYISALVDRFTAGRVFGFRASLPQVNGFSSACSAAFQVKMNRELRRVFPHLRIILLSRRDQFAQAASYWEAMRTQVWTLPEVHASPMARPAYNYAELRDALQKVVMQDWQIRQYLAETGCQYLEVSYERYVADRRATLNSIVEFLHLPPRQVQLGASLRSTEDSLTLEHAARLREDLKLEGTANQ
jgi:LPS sulfotransferase NodH